MPSRVPPGPRGHWLKGNLHDFAYRRLDFFTDLARKHGDVSSFRLGPRRVWVVNSPELIERILVTDNKQFVKHFGARMYQPLLGNGLLLSENDFWLRQRRLAQPAFLKNRIASYAPAMVALTEQMLETWKEGRPYDIYKEMSQLTGNIAVRTFFGTEAVKDRDAFNQAHDEVLHIIGARFRRLVQWPDWLPLPSNLRLRRDASSPFHCGWLHSAGPGQEGADG